ncbi:MAG: TolC family protein [Thermoanaerobaculia bacterium]
MKLHTVLLALFALPAVAEPLTLDDCVRAALEQHPSYAAATAAADAARESVGVARAAFYPTLAADAAYRRFETHVFLPEGLPLTFDPVVGPIDDWSAGVDVRYTLYDHGARRSELAGARAAHASAGAGTDATREQIVFAVHDAFYRLAAWMSSSDAAAERLRRAEAHVALARARLDAGAVPPVDVIRARTVAANARLVIANTRAATDVARGALNAAMGRPAESPLEIAPSSESIPAVDVEAAIQGALQQRPEALAAREKEAVQRARVGVAQSAFGPKARVTAGYGVRDSRLFPQDPDWYAAINLDVPLFDGNATRHRVAAANAEVRRQEAETAAVLNAIRQEVWSTGTTLEQRREAVVAAEAARQEAGEAVRLATARYDAGAGTINDLLDAEAALLEAETQIVRVRFEEQIAYAAFRKAAGKF